MTMPLGIPGLGGWDAQIAVLTAICFMVLPIIKNLPYIGKFIKDQVAVIADLVIGVVGSGIRAYFFHDAFYGNPVVVWMVVVVGVAAGFLASGGYKTIKEWMGHIGIAIAKANGK